MSITSAQSYEMRLSRRRDRIDDPPEPYCQTVERLLADRGVDQIARLLLTPYVISTTRKTKRNAPSVFHGCPPSPDAKIWRMALTRGSLTSPLTPSDLMTLILEARPFHGS
jgi:hypothetical protein